MSWKIKRSYKDIHSAFLGRTFESKEEAEQYMENDKRIQEDIIADDGFKYDIVEE